LAWVGGGPVDMSRIKLGLPGRDEDCCVSKMLSNMGELGIPLLCYNFMAQIGWARSAGEEKIRGGARATRFRLADMPERTEAGEVAAERIRENYEYFIRAVMPEAEKCGVKMGLHPDDPPLPSLCGVGRIFNRVEDFDWALSLVDSPSHGITFCQANFKLMGADLEQCIRRWGRRKKSILCMCGMFRGTPRILWKPSMMKGRRRCRSCFVFMRDQDFVGHCVAIMFRAWRGRIPRWRVTECWVGFLPRVTSREFCKV
ncbi:MAG: hypothetical protein HC904_06185, partial [Blastochloris sp.]|nr:hypothetical protein [Blastochloris sp.]